MLIVSFLWLIFSLPVLTIVPASAALFHTLSKVVFPPGKGNGVFKVFFESYKENLIIGIKLNLLIILMVLITAEGLWTGYQIWRINIWGMLYMMLGIIIAFVVITAIVHIPPVLSYFEAPVSSVIRMAVYFAIRKPLRSILFTLLFVLMIYFIEAFPLALLIVPALYGDLIRAPLNRDFMIFAKENNLETDNIEEINEEEIISEQSTYDLDRKLNKKEKNK
ncbi:MAG: DUF624 domain-containing protein [Erysipelotrichaceae bacterium]|nr:DUF624 domain-containing protein [Erysipelotrichaceae bacterium]